MRRLGHRRPMISALCVLFAVLAASLPSSAQEDPNAYPLGDGVWRAVFFIRTGADLGGVDFNYSGHGSALLDMSGGVAQGEWNMSLRANEVGQTASANAVATGFVKGDGLVQTLELDQVTSTDSQFGITVTMTAEELNALGGGNPGAGSFAMTGRSCNAATGIWLIPFNGAALTGDVIIQPLGTGAPDTQADLREEGLRLIEQAREGFVDVGELQTFVAQAEAQMEGTLRRDDCSPDDAAVFAHAGALLLDTVLVESGYALDAATDEEFLDLFAVVVRSGLLLISDDARLRWEFEFLERAAMARDSGTVTEMRKWQAAAAQYGYADTAGALARAICEEEDRGECE